MVELKQAVETLEQVGGEKAKAENEVLSAKIEELQKKCEGLDAAKVALQNQVTVSQEDRQRIDSQLQQVKKDLKEAEEKKKEMANEIDQLTHAGTSAEEKEHAGPCRCGCGCVCGCRRLEDGPSLARQDEGAGDGAGRDPPLRARAAPEAVRHRERARAAASRRERLPGLGP